MLKVTVAEVARSIIKQMGIDLTANMTYGTAVVNFNNSNPFTANGGPLVSGNSLTTSFGSTPSVHGDAARDGKRGRDPDAGRAEPDRDLRRVRRHSSPAASFRFRPASPADPDHGHDLQPSRVSFKKFGISLNFTPVVLTEGTHQPAGDDRSIRSLATKIDHAVAGGHHGGNATIPSIKTRRAETTLEIPSGGAMAMAGLIQDQTKQAINGLPGLAQLPVLGSLFRSRDYVNNQTELMVHRDALHRARGGAEGPVASG